MALLEKVLDVCIRRGFLIPGCEIYGGLAGFYDYGPLGCLLKNKLVEAWRDFCIRKEGYVAIDGANVLRGEVLEASGHVSGFVDPITKCKSCAETYRADHLLEERLNKNVEGMSKEELTRLLRENNIRCPKCKGELSDVELFHLMFKLNVGAGEGVVSYLRPETAQSIFMDFARVFKAAREKLPLGIGQVGRAYRNEISPRQVLMRMREFTQMEIEIFVDPDKVNEHPRWQEMKDVKVRLLTREAQQTGGAETEMTAEESISKGIVPNQYLAYWIAKETLFYRSIGVPYEKFRFRHMTEKETPFYSKANFDLEVSLDFGWKETIGNAYRTDYDLSSHAKHSGKDLSVNIEGKKFVPHVIEPSWGLDRMLYCVLEHCYVDKGKDREWSYFRFPPKLAPVSVCVFPLMKKLGMDAKAEEIYKSLLNSGLDAVLDESGSIGKRYARADEIGVPFCLTVDPQTMQDDTVTIRSRDTTEQIRVKISELGQKLEKFIDGEKFQ